MKRKIRFEINFSNKIVYTFISVIFLSIVGLGIYAYGTSNPAVFGHSAGELNLSGGVNGNAVFNGNVGIGTTNPARKLHVNNDANGDIARFEGKDQYLDITDTGDAVRVSTDGTGSLGFRTAAPSGGNQMVITKDGNVSIGTESPSAKLEIGGTPGVDGIKFPDGTLQTTAGITSFKQNTCNWSPMGRGSTC